MFHREKFARRGLLFNPNIGPSPPQLNFKMVTKSKLKMALLAEGGVDFKKLHQKKMAKKAQKESKSKKSSDEFEDVESEDGEDGGVELEGEDSGDDGSAQVCCCFH